MYPTATSPLFVIRVLKYQIAGNTLMSSTNRSYSKARRGLLPHLLPVPQKAHNYRQHPFRISFADGISAFRPYFSFRNTSDFILPVTPWLFNRKYLSILLSPHHSSAAFPPQKDTFSVHVPHISANIPHSIPTPIWQYPPNLLYWYIIGILCPWSVFTQKKSKERDGIQLCG